MDTFELCEMVLKNNRHKNPDIYQACYPRRYVPPLDYANPCYFAANLMAIANLLAVGKMPKPNDASSTSAHVSAWRLIESGVPTYFLSADFVRAVAATEFPDDFVLREIKWAIKCGVLVFPTSFMADYVGANIPFVAINRLMKREYFPPSILKIDTKFRIYNTIDRSLFHFPVWFDNVPVDYTSTYPLDNKISEVATCQLFNNYCTGVGGTVYEMGSSLENDIKINSKINTLIIKLLLALSTTKDYIEKGGQIRGEKRDKWGQLEKEALWSPNFIGRKYEVKRSFSKNPGYTRLPRMHWRRGHFRNHAYGKAYSLHKLIWLEPVLCCIE